MDGVSAWNLVVVEPSWWFPVGSAVEQCCVVDAGASGVAVVGEVVGFAPLGWGVAAGEGAASVSGDEGEALLLGEDAVGGGVRLDPSGCGEQDRDGACFRAGPVFGEVGGDGVAVSGGGDPVPVA